MHVQNALSVRTFIEVPFKLGKTTFCANDHTRNAVVP